jgi:protein TonB
LAPQNSLFRSQEILWRCVMRREPQKVSEEIPEKDLGSLRGCLVEGDAEQRTRERRVRRRALAVSIVLQSAVLALLILVPLFSKTQRIAFAFTTPIPPYSFYHGAPHDPGRPQPPGGPARPCRFCAPPNIPPTIPTRDPRPPGDPGDATPFEGLGSTIPGASENLIPLTDPRRKVPPPDDTQRRVTQTRIVHMTHLDPGMLLHRVEPVYPPLARQIHREGRVELRAIIGTDGNIQSLQVVAGDPLFVQSAVDAVQQWHYLPTYLNGQAVEIDTYITVVYTMQH